LASLTSGLLRNDAHSSIMISLVPHHSYQKDV